MFFAHCVLFYLPGIGLGMWFSFDHDITSKRNRFMWILAPISVIYINVLIQNDWYRQVIENLCMFWKKGGGR